MQLFFRLIFPQLIEKDYGILAKKRLVHLISSLERGGAQTLLVALIQQLSMYEHHVFYIHDGPMVQELQKRGIATYTIQGITSYKSLWLFYHLVQKIRRLKPLCIHSSLWAATVIGTLLGFFTKLPVLSVQHTPCEHEGWLRTNLKRLMPFSPTRHIAVSAHVAASLAHTYGIPAEQIVTIPNGIDTTRLSFYIRKSTPNKTSFTIGAVGRLVSVKNYSLLLESCALLSQDFDLHLILIGEGPQEQALRRSLQDLKIADKVTHRAGVDALPFYTTFDCFVQPSHYEGLSLALLEALFFQLPVIVTSPDSPHSIITHEKTGLIAAPTKEDLASSLKQLIMNKELGVRLGKAGHTMVMQEFTIERTAERYRQLIASLPVR
jgi:glycosyltransferase involved in cell wall biosynthesis